MTTLTVNYTDRSQAHFDLTQDEIEDWVVDLKRDYPDVRIIAIDINVLDNMKVD